MFGFGELSYDKLSRKEKAGVKFLLLGGVAVAALAGGKYFLQKQKNKVDLYYAMIKEKGYAQAIDDSLDAFYASHPTKQVLQKNVWLVVKGVNGGELRLKVAFQNEANPKLVDTSQQLFSTHEQQINAWSDNCIKAVRPEQKTEGAATPFTIAVFSGEKGNMTEVQSNYRLGNDFSFITNSLYRHLHRKPCRTVTLSPTTTP